MSLTHGMKSSREPLLRVEHLRAYHTSQKGLVRAVDDVSFEIHRGEAVGILGESGAGKTSVALAILGIFERLSRYYASSAANDENKRLWLLRDEARRKGLNSEAMEITLPGVEGHVWFKGKDLLTLHEEELRQIRGERISYVPQGTSKSLNPSLSIEYQAGEPLKIHYGKPINEKVARQVLDLLELVDLGDMQVRKDMFPTDFSTGEDQRVLIATSLITEPDLVITDEPTTAVDGAVRHKILSAINHARKQLGLSLLMITNDAGVVAETCDKIGVMSSGRLMEFGDAVAILKTPIHPFTRAYHMTNPTMDMIRRLREKGLRIKGIPGSPPSAVDVPSGCPFHTRCEYMTNLCRDEVPEYREIEKGHWVFCHHSENLPAF